MIGQEGIATLADGASQDLVLPASWPIREQQDLAQQV